MIQIIQLYKRKITVDASTEHNEEYLTQQRPRVN